MTIKDILKPDEYENLTQFSKEEIKWLNKRIKTRKDGKPGVECIIRGKNSDGDYFELKPEEIVRQLYTYQLINTYEYKKEQIAFEVVVNMGRDDSKRADIVIYEDKNKYRPYIVVECKKIGEKEVKNQLSSYCQVLGASIGVIIDGGNLEKYFLNCESINNKNRHLEPIACIPKATETLSQIIDSRFTIKDLIINDELKRTTLKKIILDLEDKIMANNGVNSFEEIFMLIFTKLYDEKKSADDAEKINMLLSDGYLKDISEVKDDNFRLLEFRDVGTPSEVARRVKKLFDDAKKEWQGIFKKDATFSLNDADLKMCVNHLQNVKILNTNLEVVDDAFEYLVNQEQKGQKGQYFTPRIVIDMCVRMMNPKKDENMIDTASGSCGFPMHTILYVWKQMNPSAQNYFLTKRSNEEIDYVKEHVFAIDFDDLCVRVGKTLNIIAGDGHSNVMNLNTLDYTKWKETTARRDWLTVYNDGFRRLEGLCEDTDTYKDFKFDVLLANPPFAGDRSDSQIISLYELGHNDKGKLRDNVGRDVLFIERNISFLKPGGRMAVVLPQGRFNNASDKYIRDFIARNCRILAVVGLHPNTFLEHTGTKTSVLFVQKWTDEDCDYPNICPRPEPNKDGDIDYPIFFATAQEPTGSNQKEKIYVDETYVVCTRKSYETLETITKKSDGTTISAEEYSALDKVARKSYKVTMQTVIRAEGIKNEHGDTRIIKDLFVEDYGSLDSHRKWIKKNVVFTLKSNKEGTGAKSTLSVDEYLALSAENRKNYKETPIVGKNENKEIGLAEYRSLKDDEKKYYLVSEEITETTEHVTDTHGHIFVKHDLFNHDPELDAKMTAYDKRLAHRYSHDGIAEAFAEFAKKEKLSFF